MALSVTFLTVLVNNNEHYDSNNEHDNNNNKYYKYKGQKQVDEGKGSREDGDNDNKEPKQCQTCVVWVIGEFFKKILFMFLYTNKCCNAYLGYYSSVEQQQ